MMSPIESLGEGLVILPSPTDSGPAEGVSGHLPTSRLPWDEGDASEVGVEGLYPYWPDIEKISANVSASSLPALRNDSGEAVWRLTEKALLHFADSRVRLCPRGVRIQLGRYLGSAGGETVGTSESSEP